MVLSITKTNLMVLHVLSSVRKSRKYFVKVSFLQLWQEIWFYRHLRTLQLLFENGSKRPIFVDGCNVGFNHSQHNNFSVEGLEIALNTLAGLGHTALAVVPRNKYFFVALF